jgi:hypothetical protein
MNLLERIKHLAQRDNPEPDGEIQQEIVQRAVERISGDETLTGDLSDEGAKLLLKFAHSEVIRLVNETKGLDADSTWTAIEPQLSILRQNLRKIARESAQAADPIAELEKRLVPPCPKI